MEEDSRDLGCRLAAYHHWIDAYKKVFELEWKTTHDCWAIRIMCDLLTGVNMTSVADTLQQKINLEQEAMGEKWDKIIDAREKVMKADGSLKW